MYLELTGDNVSLAKINDDGWPKVKANGQRWERIEPGLWKNIETGDTAVQQRSGNWRYRRRTYKCIKKIMLIKRKNLS